MSAPTPSAQRHGTLVAAIATVACCDVAMGLTLQLLPLLMESRAIPAWIIGLNAAMSPLGIIVAGPFLPGIVRRCGTKPVVYTVIVLVMLALLSFKVFESLPAWFVIRFVFGMAAGTLFTISEAWILSSAEAGNRGRVMGVYTSVLAVTFAVGPLIIPLTGIDGWTPWLIGIACVGLSAAPLAFVRIGESSFESRGEGFFGFVRRAPLLLFAVATVTMFDAIILSFFPIFGLRSGLSLAAVSYILAVGIIGNAVMQYPIGLLADKWSKMSVIVLSGLITAILSLSMIWTIGSWLIWPVMLILGTAAFAIYTVALALLGDRFEGSDLISGSAAFGAMWGVGGIIGPPIAGAAIDTFGVNAVPVTLASIYAVLLAGIALTGGILIREPARG